MKLFAISIGGDHPAAHIEVHDVRFIAAETIEATHAQLRAEWWGTPGTLHVDCWAEIDHADGYDISLRPEPAPPGDTLYFVNLGGYDPRHFAERHKAMFVVAASPKAARRRALRLVSGWADAHEDDLYEAEHAFALGTRIGDRLHVHLTPSALVRELRFTCRYTPLA